jgi:hypothetical protein
MLNAYMQMLQGRGYLMKRSGNCSNCARGTSIKVNPDILCSIHGAVSRNYRCSKYVRKVAQWSVEAPGAGPGTQWENKCIECECFLVTYSDPENKSSIGYCKLFTVRHFDGSKKNACSKFSRKPVKNIS